MKRILIVSLLSCLTCGFLYAANIIPANNPYIQYFGRWDFSDSLAPTHSWPGVYMYAEFEGTSIGITTDDNSNYYNVFIDGAFIRIFQGDISGVASYTLASGLTDTNHSIVLTLRNETDTKFSFNGFILDDGKNLLPPPVKPEKKIEFIGDSYTSASGNEWTDSTYTSNNLYTNVYEGFCSILARHYGAQYMTTSKSGIGLSIDFTGSYNNVIPAVYDRTLLSAALPKWNYSQWVPNLVVICLGLNDYYWWNNVKHDLSEEASALYRTKYHDLIATVMGEYPGANILAVAANNIEWLTTNVSQVVAEENVMGHSNVHYAYFPKYNNNEYVNNGHPTVTTHHKIADTLIYTIDTMNVWQPYHGTVSPRITQTPESPFTVYDTSYILNIQTDSYATMRFSTQDKTYDQMENQFTTTGKRNHSITLSCHHGIQYTYYLRGIDIYGHAMDTSAVIHFTVDTTKQPVHWTSLFYDDSQWKNGPAPLSNINDTSTATLLPTVTTAYFRKKITIDSTENIASLIIWIKGHDGAIVYVNDQEHLRINLLAGTEITYSTYALDSTVFTKRTLSSVKDLLHYGENIIAVEVHTMSGQNRHMSFDSKLTGGSANINFPYGTAWTYYDGGKMPDDIVVDKPTEVVQGMENLLPAKLILYTNYPNPFNPTTTIRYELPVKSRVSMKIFDLLGREIVTLVDEEKPAGTYTVQFNAGTLSSGMYFCRLHTAQSAAVSKLLLVK